MNISTREQHAFERLASQIGWAEQVSYQNSGKHMIAIVPQGGEETQQYMVYVTPIWGGPRNGHAGRNHQGNRKPRTKAQREAQAKAMRAYWRNKRNGG